MIKKSIFIFITILVISGIISFIKLRHDLLNTSNKATLGNVTRITQPAQDTQPTKNTPQSTNSNANTTNSSATTQLAAPIKDAAARITKKPFGIYVSPGNSPVSPERFQGYHTGVDFETYPDEQNTDVPINAVCTGPLLVKKYATGYGGVAVQKCTLDNNPVTIIYGHLRLSSIKPNTGDIINTGQQFALLGNGYSTETSGERKHLHLGIHKGSTIDISGYVEKYSELDAWLDAAKYL